MHALGSTSSTDPMSFEKRFKIRPDGLVWKNLIDARVIEWNILLCKLIDARIASQKNINERPSVMTIKDMTIAVN